MSNSSLPGSNNILALGTLPTADPRADSLKAAFQQHNDPNAPRIAVATDCREKCRDSQEPVIIASDKKVSERAPADPVIISPEAETVEVKLQPFEDGALFRAMPNPRKPGSFLLLDGAGTCVAVVRDGQISNILCHGAHLVYEAFLRNVAEAKARDSAAVSTPEGQ